MGPDVKDCSKNFPRAIFFAAGMQTLINGVLHLVAAGATDPADYPDWKPGYLRWASRQMAAESDSKTRRDVSCCHPSTVGGDLTAGDGT